MATAAASRTGAYARRVGPVARRTFRTMSTTVVSEDRHRDEQRDEVERVEQPGIPADQQQVARAARALAVRARIPEELPGGRDDQPGAVRGEHERPLEPRGEPAAREGEDEVHEDRDAEPEVELGQGERQSRVPGQVRQ